MASVLKSKIIELFNSGYSYREISKQLRCSISTISFHCSKFIEKDKNDRYSVDKLKIYQEYYDKGFSLKDTALYFNVSRHTLSKKLKIRKLNKLQKEQKSQVRKKDYRIRVKKQCIEYKGGKCCICSYDRCINALEFHHINPKEKDFLISGGTKSFENLKKELDKCILVCSNCHREIHSGLHILPDINPRTDTASKG